MENKKESKEKIEEWINELNDSTETIIIVEGNKDKKSLLECGIKKDIAILNKPLFEKAEEIAQMKYRKAIILTDFDKKGKELYGKIRKELLKNGIKVDSHFREFLQKNTKLSHIEGMKKYLNNL